jgi:hypothetical protein
MPKKARKKQKIKRRVSDPQAKYVLPLKWSLYYVLSQGEWQDFRNRVKEQDSEWMHCPVCPKRCPADQCDEQWEYDHKNHVKQFVTAKFICRGCHWMKSPGARLITWARDLSGELPPPKQIPHIQACLGWTRKEVDALRMSDLLKEEFEEEMLDELRKKAKWGKALIRPWKIDLSGLEKYDYSRTEIVIWEARFIERANSLVAAWNFEHAGQST